jgi:hypothetical protein
MFAPLAVIVKRQNQTILFSKNDGQKFYTFSCFENRKADIEATRKQ